MSSQCFMPSVSDIAIFMAWRWPIDTILSVWKHGRDSLSSAKSNGIDRGSQTEPKLPQEQQRPTWSKEVNSEDRGIDAEAYSDRDTPALVWIEDGGKKCPALVLTNDFSETLRQAVDCIRDIATHNGRVQKQKVYSSNLKERVTFQLRRLNDVRIESIQSSDSDDNSIRELRNQKDSLMQTLDTIDAEATASRSLPLDLSRRRDQISSRVFAVINGIFERANLIEPYDVPIEDPVLPVELGLLEFLEGTELSPNEQDDQGTQFQGDETSAEDSVTMSDSYVPEEEKSLGDLFNAMMEQLQHVHHLREQLEDQAADLENLREQLGDQSADLEDLEEQLEDQSAHLEDQQTLLDDMVLRLEANDIDCPTGKDSVHMEDFFEDLIYYRDRARSLQNETEGDSVHEIGFTEANARYQVNVARLEKAGFDCQAIEDALDRQARGFAAGSSVVGSYDLLKDYERQLALTIIAKEEAEERMRSQPSSDAAEEPHDDENAILSVSRATKSDFTKDEAQEARIELEVVSPDEDSRSLREEDLMSDSASDPMEYYNEDVSRWEKLYDNAEKAFDQALQDLDEAGFCCPDLSGRDKLPTNYNFNFAGKNIDDDDNPDKKVNMIKSLLGLANIPKEPHQVQQWLYQRELSADEAGGAESLEGDEIVLELDHWDSQSVSPSECQSLQRPTFTEKTNQDKLRQWQRVTNRLRLEFSDAAQDDDVFEGVGALFGNVAGS